MVPTVAIRFLKRAPWWYFTQAKVAVHSMEVNASIKMNTMIRTFMSLLFGLSLTTANGSEKRFRGAEFENNKQVHDNLDLLKCAQQCPQQSVFVVWVNLFC